jgi:glucose/arabinose dehydrogenase
MDIMRAIIFSVIAIAVVAGASISLTYVGVDNGNGTLSPAPPANNTGSPPAQGSTGDAFTVLPDSSPPRVSDAGLKVEKVAEGLALPTSMTFVGRDDIMITQKDNGMVRLVSDGALQEKPILDVFVEKNSERGLLGVAVTNSTAGEERTVFLYYTESSGDEVRNRVYKYDWDGSGNLTGGTIVLDLPGQPGPNHDGGKLVIGPDGMIYTVIGDLNRNGVLQNYRDGPEPDDTSVILRVDGEGNGADGAMPGDLSEYYAYGIRNSFGLDFDPLTGTLWDTENGPADYDEINVVTPGFNSGWEQVMGPIERKGVPADSLVQLDGSHYADPVFSWRAAQGVTDIEFLNSTRLGEKYAHNVFVGDINNGNLYFFTVNGARDGLELAGGLQDRVADNNAEVDSVTLGTGFGAITDVETGPDGYLYILTLGGDLYRIVPAG